MYIIPLLEALFSTIKRRFVDEKAITNLRNKDRANFQILGLLSKVKTAFREKKFIDDIVGIVLTV